MTDKTTDNMTEAELADYYDRTHDLSEFDEESVPVEVRRSATISVRFSPEELDQLREFAETIGWKVTTLIRAAALDAARREVQPIDREALSRAVQGVQEQTHELADILNKQLTWPRPHLTLPLAVRSAERDNDERDSDERDSDERSAPSGRSGRG